MKILLLHGKESGPGGKMPTYLAEHGFTVINPALPKDDFDASVRIAQAAFDEHAPEVVVGSLHGTPRRAQTIDRSISWEDRREWRQQSDGIRPILAIPQTRNLNANRPKKMISLRILPVALLACFAQPAQALIVFTDIADFTISGTTQAVSVNFANGTATSWPYVGNYTPPLPFDTAVNFIWQAPTIEARADASGFTGFRWTASPSGYGSLLQVDRLTAGTVIGDGDPFSPDARFYASAGDWADGQAGFLGVRFIVGSASTIRYGWMEVSYASSQFTIRSFAYEDTGASIAAGAIPEPSDAALVFGALSVLVVAVTRRRSTRSRQTPNGSAVPKACPSIK